MSGRDRFVMVPVDVIEHPDVGPYEIAAYVVIRKHHNRSTGQCNPSIDTIADQGGMSRGRALKAVARLDEIGAPNRTVGQHRGGNSYAFPDLETVHHVHCSDGERCTEQCTDHPETVHETTRNSAPRAPELEVELKVEPEVARAGAREPQPSPNGASNPQGQPLRPWQEALERTYGSPDYDDNRLSFKERDDVRDLAKDIEAERARERQRLHEQQRRAALKAWGALVDREGITDVVVFGERAAQLRNDGELPAAVWHDLEQLVYDRFERDYETFRKFEAAFDEHRVRTDPDPPLPLSVDRHGLSDFGDTVERERNP